MDKIKSYAAPMLVLGCVLFGLGSLIVNMPLHFGVYLLPLLFSGS